MGIETDAVRELQDRDDPIEALFGRMRRAKAKLPYPEGTVFKFFVGCLNDDETRERYEDLLTRSYRCQNDLKKPGDLAVLDINGTFDKDGCYHVVSRYAILPEGAKQ